MIKPNLSKTSLLNHYFRAKKDKMPGGKERITMLATENSH
jgi:hypothetical protein